MEELLEQILKDAIEKSITDLHFKSLNEPCIYMRIKNEVKPYQQMRLESYQKLMTYLQFKARLNFNHLQKPQTGAFHLQLNKMTYYFRLSYLPTNNDIHLVLRILNHQNKIQFDSLTDDSELKKAFTQLIFKSSGLIVVCGPTGSGKSTTLHCFLDVINEMGHKNIVTIEDPIEIYVKGLIQTQVNEQAGLSFDEILKQVLRHDPDVVMIGELRDQKSAEIAIKLALTGHLVLTTLHAKDGPSALKRLYNLNIQEDDLQQCLIGIISQRLFYHCESKDPFVLFESISNEALHDLFMQKKSYISLAMRLEEAYKKGWISDDIYQQNQ